MGFQRIFRLLVRGLNHKNIVKIISWSISNKIHGFSQYKKDAKAQERPFSALPLVLAVKSNSIQLIKDHEKLYPRALPNLPHFKIQLNLVKAINQKRYHNDLKFVLLARKKY